MASGVFDVRDTPTSTISASCSAFGLRPSSCLTANSSASTRSKYPRSVTRVSPASHAGRSLRHGFERAHRGTEDVDGRHAELERDALHLVAQLRRGQRVEEHGRVPVSTAHEPRELSARRDLRQPHDVERLVRRTA